MTTSLGAARINPAAARAREAARTDTGEFGVQHRGEADVDLTATTPEQIAAGLAEQIETVRAEAYAAGKRDGFLEAGMLLAGHAELALAVQDHPLTLADGSQMSLPRSVTEAITDKVAAASHAFLSAYAHDGFADDASRSSSATVPPRPLDPAVAASPGTYGMTPSGDVLCMCVGRGCWRCEDRGCYPATPTGQDVVVSEVYFGVQFTRRRDQVWPDEPQAIRIEANRPLTQSEVERVAQLVGYRYAATVRGEPMSMPVRDSDRSFVLAADTTKSRSDDLGAALDAFEDGLDAHLYEGSPVRTTDRAGVGTRGTRLVEGLGDPDLTVEIYYDDVTGA